MVMKRKLVLSKKLIDERFSGSIYEPCFETDLKKKSKKEAGKAARENLKILRKIDKFYEKEGTELFRYFKIPVLNTFSYYQVINQDSNSGQLLVKKCNGINLDEISDSFLKDEVWVDYDFVLVALQLK